VRHLNPYAVASALGARIVGPVGVGHGQIDSLGDAQRYFDALARDDESHEHDTDKIDVKLLRTAFEAARAVFKDRKSTDLYVADPERNAMFLQKCRELGIQASDKVINRRLLNARKNKLMTGLKSEKTSIDYDDFAFASEFAATQLRYMTGATIDDILCDYVLASQFDAIARKITPGHSSFEYRWAILSIRKAAGRREDPPEDFRMPKFTKGFHLIRDPLERIPDDGGVYLLYEKNQLLYARSTDRLRHGIELHRDPRLIQAISKKLLRPDPNDFIVDYATAKRHLNEIERRLVEERHPIFNVPRQVA
jgi:hypothetical protein